MEDDWISWIFIAIIVIIWFSWFTIPSIIDWIKMERMFKEMDKKLEKNKNDQ